MAMRRVSALAAIAVVRALRDDALAVLSTEELAGAEDAAEAGDFPCPDECLQCCGFQYGFGLLTSSSSFKCIIARGQEMPEQEGCVNRGPRSTNHQHDKVECPFTEEQKAHKDSLGECSEWFRCCCDEREDWSEFLCLAGQPDEVERLSERSGKVERYVLAKAQYKLNRDEPCQLPGSVALEYQTKHNGPMRSDGCCLKTEQGSQSYKYFAGYKKNHGSLFGRSQKKYKTRYLKYTRCGQWEHLPYCTGAGEKRYERVMKDEGVCVGHEYMADHDELCPDGMTDRFQHQTCSCGAGCYR